MGIVPTPDYDEGDSCLLCFGSGKTFGDVPTPERIKVVFSGIQSCPLKSAPTGGTYILTQYPGYPCFYTATDGPLYIEASFYTAGGSPVTLVTLYEASKWYFSGTGPICSTIISNDLDLAACSIAGNNGFGGQAEISWGPEI